MIIRLAIFCIAITTFSGCAQQENQSGKSGQKSAWDKSEADARANAPLAKDPTITADTYFTTGLLLEKQSDLAGAVRNYQKALEIKPDYLKATNRLGEIYMRLKQYDYAEAVYRHAINYQPKSTALLNNLAFTHIAQKQYADAEAELNRVLQLDPQFSRARVNLGLVKAKQGKYDEALKAFRQVCPEDEANYNLAMILHAEGKVELARKYYSLALGLNPAFEAARKGLQQLATMPASQPVSPATPVKPVKS
jgi:tetratricopeptide (TPR) repeat protein